MLNQIFCRIQLIAVLFFLASCGGGIDDSYQISGGYELISDGDHNYLMSNNIFKQSVYPSVIDYSFDQDFILVKQKASKKKYISMLSSELWSKYYSLSTADSTNSEYKMGQFDFYKDYLDANSKLFDVLHAKGISNENNIEDRRISKSIADSLVENDPYYQNIFSRELNYWIISHKERNETDYLPMSRFYGPYSKEEYLKKRIEIGVSPALALETEQD